MGMGSLPPAAKPFSMMAWTCAKLFRERAKRPAIWFLVSARGLLVEPLDYSRLWSIPKIVSLHPIHLPWSPENAGLFPKPKGAYNCMDRSTPFTAKLMNPCPMIVYFNDPGTKAVGPKQKRLSKGQAIIMLIPSD